MALTSSQVRGAKQRMLISLGTFKLLMKCRSRRGCSLQGTTKSRFACMVPAMKLARKPDVGSLEQMRANLQASQEGLYYFQHCATALTIPLQCYSDARVHITTLKAANILQK